MDIQQDIKDAIEKQLPAAVGEVLRARLEQADKDAKLVASQKTRIDELNVEARRHTAMIDQRDEQLKRHGDLDKRAADLDKRERELKMTILETQLFAEKAKAEFMKDVTLGLVRNIEYRQSVFNNSTRQVPTPGGYPTSVPETSNTTNQSSAA